MTANIRDYCGSENRLIYSDVHVRPANGLRLISAKMTFEIYKDSAQFSQFITLIIFTPLGIVVTALRFVAVRRVARKVGSEDWLALIATIFFILTNLAGLMGKSFPYDTPSSAFVNIGHVIINSYQHSQWPTDHRGSY